MDTSPPRGPEALPVGQEVGPWRVVALCGRGTYGAVYRVEHAHAEEGTAYALKMAVHPWDPRFEREAELLRRVEHPGVPRLRDWGEWKARGGGVFPYLVMEWVEGERLYAWAEAHRVSAEEVARVLGEVARALEAVHAAGGVHRDVKGDRALLQRMLSEEPSARGSTAEVAQRFEDIARGSRQETEQVLEVSSVERLKGRNAWEAPAQRAHRWAPWAALAVSGALAISGMWIRQSVSDEGTGAGREHTRADEERDAGTVGLADTVLEVPASGDSIGETTQQVGLDMPKQPFPGQRQPPCGTLLVAVNGGCWVRTGEVTPPCGADAYEWKKECYVPALPPPRPQTSQPQ
jgi:hypothetical protein